MSKVAAPEIHDELLAALIEEQHRFFQKCHHIICKFGTRLQTTPWMRFKVESYPRDLDLLNHICVEVGWEDDTFATIWYPIGRPMSEDAVALISHGSETKYGPYDAAGAEMHLVGMLKVCLHRHLLDCQERAKELEATLAKLN